MPEARAGGGGNEGRGSKLTEFSRYKVNESGGWKVQPGGYSYRYCVDFKVAKKVALKSSGHKKKNV